MRRSISSGEQVRDFANDIAAKALPNLPLGVRIDVDLVFLALAQPHLLLMFF
jgi:hypothetical protein